MTELNVTQTSAAAPGADTVVVDVGDGRKLTLTYPGPLAQYEIVLALGNEASENTRFVSMCLPLIYLSAIDETPVQLPASLLQVKALIGRLGHKGLAALTNGVKQFDDKEDTEAAKK
jgi:hypothetical protein